jgi:hypothetical protein
MPETSSGKTTALGCLGAAVAAVLVFVGLRNVLSGSEDEKSTLASERVEESD